MRMVRLGTLPSGGPLEFSSDLLSATHWAIRGRTNQRKTLFVLSLVLQHVRAREQSVVFIDLGGDQAAYWMLRYEAERAGKPFYLFSLGPYEGCSWDFLKNTPAFMESPKAAVNGLAAGLKLEHGDGYGRSYWARLAASEISRAFRNLRVAGNHLPTFHELADELRRLAETLPRNQTSEAFLAADQMY